MKSQILLAALGGLIAASSWAKPQLVTGGAPKGNDLVVAAKIIKANHPKCKQVSNAKRNPDRSIAATCDKERYLVFTLFLPQEGVMHEVAMNCTAGKELLGENSC